MLWLFSVDATLPKSLALPGVPQVISWSSNLMTIDIIDRKNPSYPIIYKPN
jgi:hypothetical protein